MKSPLDWALTPLKRYADFTGRSTRSEVAFFYILTSAINLAVSWAGVAAGLAASRGLTLAYTMVMLCPWIALGARRLHDTGRSGWWQLLALPTLAVGLWDNIRKVRQPDSFPEPLTIPPAVLLLSALGLLAWMILLLLPDQEQDNIYGPNPRYGEREAAA